MNDHSIIGPGKERKRIKIFNSPEEYFNSEEFKGEQRLKELEKNKEQSLDLQITNETILNTLQTLKETGLYNPTLQLWKEEISIEPQTDRYETFTQLIEIAILTRIGEIEQGLKKHDNLIQKGIRNGRLNYWNKTIQGHKNKVIMNARTEFMNLIALKPHNENINTQTDYTRLTNTKLYDKDHQEWYEDIIDPYTNKEIIPLDKTTPTQLLSIIALNMNDPIEGAKQFYNLPNTPFCDKQGGRFNIGIDTTREAIKTELIFTNIELIRIIADATLQNNNLAYTNYEILKSSKLYQGIMWRNSYNPKNNIVFTEIKTNNQLLALLAEAMIIYKNPNVKKVI